MELLAVALLWPFLLLLVGFVFLSGWSISGLLILPIIVVFFVFAFGMNVRLGGGSELGTEQQQLDRVRRGLITFAIALLLPMFVEYMMKVSGNNLPTMLLALVMGFGALIWGMFIRHNKVLSYANITGGAFTIIYLYFQIWSLGQLAQIVATAFGLVVAIIISVVKFRDKLT
jgi:hypothetical protein